MIPVQEQSHIQEPSAQILDRIEIDEAGQNTQSKHQQFNPDPIEKAMPLEEITGDFGKSTNLKILYLIFAIVFVMSCAIGFQTVLYGYEYIESGSFEVVSCSNPVQFRLNGEIKCSEFDLDTNPVIGIVAKVNQYNQYLSTRLLITRPTRKFEMANVAARLSVYSLEQNDDKNNPYVKKEVITENQKIVLEAETKSVSYSYYTSNEQGFVVPISIIRPLKEAAYMIVLRLDTVQMRYLETAERIRLASEYIPEQTFFIALTAKVVCIIAIIVFSFLFNRNIRSQEPPQVQLADHTKHQQRVLLYFGLIQCVCLDPISPLTLIRPNIFSDILSSLFLTVQLSSIVLLSFYFLNFYISKEFMTKRQMFIPALIATLMSGIYAFGSTFLEWRNLSSTGEDIIYLVLGFVGIVPLLYPIAQGITLLFNHRQYETRHLGFYFLSSGILLVLAGAIARFEYRVYAIEMAPVVVPVMIATYVFCLHYFFQAESYEESPVQPPVESTPTQVPQCGAQSHSQKEQKTGNKDDMDYFDIEQRTQQFEERSQNTAM